MRLYHVAKIKPVAVVTMGCAIFMLRLAYYSWLGESSSTVTHSSRMDAPTSSPTTQPEGHERDEHPEVNATEPEFEPPPSPITPASKKSDASWQMCASEGDRCTCTGTVVYGRKYASGTPGAGRLATTAETLGARHRAQDVDGSTICSSAAFGDPLDSVYKHCLCNKASTVANIDLKKPSDSPPSHISCKGLKCLPKFIYPEEGNLYFGVQAIGLKHTIDTALAQGCMANWEGGAIDIEIMFGAGTVPSKTHYVQYQMEQLANEGLFTPIYDAKLATATQLWDFSAHHCAHHAQKYKRRCDHVPLWLTDGPTWKVPATMPAKRFDALHFGEANPKRRKLCNDVLNLGGVNAFCSFSLWGPALEEHILAAKVVMIEHYFPHAVLPVHRINQVLSRGVPVIIPHSVDPQLDARYAEMGVVFSAAGGDSLAADVKALVIDPARLDRATKAALKYNQHKQRSLAPICEQLGRLYEDVKRKNAGATVVPSPTLHESRQRHILRPRHRHILRPVDSMKPSKR